MKRGLSFFPAVQWPKERVLNNSEIHKGEAYSIGER